MLRVYMTHGCKSSETKSFTIRKVTVLLIRPWWTTTCQVRRNCMMTNALVVGPSWRTIRAQDYIKCNWISHYDYTHRWKWCIRIMLRLLSYLVLISLKFVQKETSLHFYSFLSTPFILFGWIARSSIYDGEFHSIYYYWK